MTEKEVKQKITKKKKVGVKSPPSPPPATTPSDCLDQAKDVIYGEISKLCTKASLRKLLDKTQADILNNYVKTLVLLNKDERDDVKGANLEATSDKELEDLAKQAVKYLEQKEKK
jgi:hypothetical protein